MGRSKEFDEKKVLQIAMELFWLKGYEAVSIRDLVEHMGIHRKSIYDTFGDKHSLYIQALDYYKKSNIENLKYQLEEVDSAKQAIENIFNYIIEDTSEERYGCFLVNATTEMAHKDKDVEVRIDEAFLETERYLTELIKKGKATGEFTLNCDEQVLAEVLHNALLGIRVLKRSSEQKEKLRRIRDFFMKQLIRS